AAPRRSGCAPGGPVFEDWAELAAQGVRPALVLAELASDSAHLTSRGITEVCTPEEVVRPPRRPSSSVPHRRSTS
ncbi:glycosyl hydrolase, partial [Streptomyces decoyicus]